MLLWEPSLWPAMRMRARDKTVGSGGVGGIDAVEGDARAACLMTLEAPPSSQSYRGSMGTRLRIAQHQLIHAPSI